MQNHHDLQNMSRVLHRHDWDTLDDWVHAVDELAELNDDDIENVVRMADREPDRVFFE
jgi:hypothetical protein